MFVVQEVSMRVLVSIFDVCVCVDGTRCESKIRGCSKDSMTRSEKQIVINNVY